MGDSGDGQDADSTLSELFDRCLKLVKEVREASVPSTDPELQSLVRSAISGLESLTRQVSAAGLFSSNESAEELPTGSLRLLLLPALLGELTCRLAHEERMQVIGIAEVYYRDFLQRCRDYGIVDVDIPGPRARGDDSGGASGGGGGLGSGGGGGGGSGGASGGAHHIQQAPRAPTMRDLATMSKQREERLRRYREQKELDKKLAELEEALRRPGADEETARTYQLTLLKQAAARAVSELQSLQLEKPILEHMQQLKNARGGAAAAADATPAPTVAPLRPVVITRTKLEAAVFGAGYSSLPTMSVEEFYEQRVRDGVFPGGGQQGATSLVNQPAPTTTDDDKEEERDRLEDTDDAVSLARARQWDDYRDTHKRGEGNRYNRS